jgi:phosphoglycerate-specific signal transduction histidine kinase
VKTRILKIFGNKKKIKGQKQSKADLHDKQIKAIVNTLKNIIGELDNIRNLSVGTLETVKLMSCYQSALMQLQEQMKEEAKGKEEENVG